MQPRSDLFLRQLSVEVAANGSGYYSSIVRTVAEGTAELILGHTGWRPRTCFDVSMP